MMPLGSEINNRVIIQTEVMKNYFFPLVNISTYT